MAFCPTVCSKRTVFSVKTSRLISPGAIAVITVEPTFQRVLHTVGAKARLSGHK